MQGRTQNWQSKAKQQATWINGIVFLCLLRSVVQILSFVSPFWIKAITVPAESEVISTEALKDFSLCPLSDRFALILPQPYWKNALLGLRASPNPYEIHLGLYTICVKHYNSRHCWTTSGTTVERTLGSSIPLSNGLINGVREACLWSALLAVSSTVLMMATYFKYNYKSLIWKMAFALALFILEGLLQVIGIGLFLAGVKEVDDQQSQCFSSIAYGWSFYLQIASLFCLMTTALLTTATLRRIDKILYPLPTAIKKPTLPSEVRPLRSFSDFLTTNLETREIRSLTLSLLDEGSAEDKVCACASQQHSGETEPALGT